MAATFDDPLSTTSDPNQSTAKSRLRPRCTLNRLALALGGVAAGALGQYSFSRDSLWDGLLLYGVAVILFIRALAYHLPRSQPQEQAASGCTFQTLNLQAGWWRNVGVWLILLAAAMSFMALNFFGNPDARLQAWWLYLGSLVLLVSGGLLLTRGDAWSLKIRALLPDRHTAIGLTLVIGLALFMRLYHFDSQPFGIWFDEAEAGLQARRILQEPTYRPILFAPINISGHLLAVYAVALKWLGDNIYSMRLVSVFLGVGGVLAAYLFGRQLRGPRFGLALAFLVAVARWHVNFSRIAMTGIDTPFFEFLSLFFLTRLLQRGRLRDAMWAGLSIGLGLVFYTAFRLYTLALLIFALVAVPLYWRWLTATLRDGGWAAQLARLLMLLLAGWLVVMPVVKFALDNPEAFWYRTQQISIFTKRDQADLGQALQQSASKHLLMFNYQGDKNGRHNLPGEPMLDPAMAVLFILGIGLALARPLYPANTFFLVLFPLSLMGGILSVDFEAPQSLRSIAVIPAVIYFCGVPLVALGREAERVLAPLPRVWLVGPAVILAGSMLFFNAYTYFVRQANDFASWNAFSTPETITGQKMAELGPTYEFYLSPFLMNHPTLNFLSPYTPNHISIPLTDPLPIRSDATRPVAIFTHPDDSWVYEEAARLYPSGSFESVSKSPTDPPVVQIALLQPSDIASIQGLTLRYWPGTELDPAESPAYTFRVNTIDVDWSTALPMAPPFVAEWKGFLYVDQYEMYHLQLNTPDKAILEIDGIEVWSGEAGEQQVDQLLARGNHLLRLEVLAETGQGQVQLGWTPPGGPEQVVIPANRFYQPPITNHGLLGKYYPNPDWQEPVAFMQIDSLLDTYFHLTPLPRPYSVEWTGVLNVPFNGVYRLGLRAVGDAQFFIDDELLLDIQAPTELLEAPLPEMVTSQRQPLSMPIVWPVLLGYIVVVGGSYFLLRWQNKLNWFLGLASVLTLLFAGSIIGSLVVYFSSAEPIVEQQGPILLIRGETDQYTERTASLAAGPHEIKVLFKDFLPRSRIHLLWATPNYPELQPIPNENLWPNLASAQQATPEVSPEISDFQGQEVHLTHLTTLDGLIEPRDIAVGPQGNVYVVDTGFKGIQVFANGQLVTGWTETSDGPFEEPFALVVTSDGRVWVLDSIKQEVYIFDATGIPLGKLGLETADLYFPRGLALLAQPGGGETLAIVNTGGGKILFYNLKGGLLGAVGTFGDAPGQFNEPVDVLRDKAGTYFITEGANINRWQQLDPAGQSLQVWPLDSPVAFDGSHLAWGPDGSIFMSNSTAHTIRCYSPAGSLLNEWHSIGPVTLNLPVGIFTDDQNRLYVADIGARVIYVFDIDNNM
jgi:DNA-binding beta-propeller fold protein YncE/4-amino-4-deoxy-L-arabinose transferase-like glycosyltransferase